MQSAALAAGSKVWVEDDAEAWVEAEVLSVEKDGKKKMATVRTLAGKEVRLTPEIEWKAQRRLVTDVGHCRVVVQRSTHVLVPSAPHGFLHALMDPHAGALPWLLSGFSSWLCG